jgi:hypothetical protein
MSTVGEKSCYVWRFGRSEEWKGIGYVRGSEAMEEKGRGGGIVRREVIEEDQWR